MMTKEFAVTMTLTTPVAETLPTTSDDAAQPPVDEAPNKPAARKTAGRKAKTIELVLTGTGHAAGARRDERKQSHRHLDRDLAAGQEEHRAGTRCVRTWRT